MQSELPGASQPYIFVSYASADRERVLRVAGALREAGLRLWIDLSDIPGGAQYGSEIGDAIRGCQAVALMCSPAAFASRNVKQEIMLAWKYHRPYLPLLLEPAVFPLDVEYWLEGSQWIEVLDQPAEAWAPRVLQALARIDDAPRPNGAMSPPAVAPWIASVLPMSSGMVGRSGLVRQLGGLLRDGASRLVTLTGPGGTGKTRLAVEVANALRSHFDAAVFVSLASIADPALVAPTVAMALGLREEQGKACHDQIVAAIGRQRLLLVIDNFEQVIDAAAEVDAIVRSCPTLTVLTTSRTRLGIYGEQELPVPPLERPDLG
ncbi:MAG TPA: TIR domain-containing protein, partial [Thermomicrobiales bacterium]|nr:TIR domain-containing protein [Thermomicrobiales bacterium]